MQYVDALSRTPDLRAEAPPKHASKIKDADWQLSAQYSDDNI